MHSHANALHVRSQCGAHPAMASCNADVMHEEHEGRTLLKDGALTGHILQGMRLLQGHKLKTDGIARNLTIFRPMLLDILLYQPCST